MLELGIGWVEETARRALLRVSATAADDEDVRGVGDAAGEVQVCAGPPEVQALALTVPVSFQLRAPSGEQVLRGQLEAVWLNHEETQLGLTLSYQFSSGEGLFSHRSVQVAILSFLDQLRMTLASRPAPQSPALEHPGPSSAPRTT